MEAQLLDSAGVYARKLDVGEYDTRRGNSCLYLHALLGYAWLLGSRGGPPRAYQDVPQVPPAAPRAPLLVAGRRGHRSYPRADAGQFPPPSRRRLPRARRAHTPQPLLRAAPVGGGEGDVH